MDSPPLVELALRVGRRPMSGVILVQLLADVVGELAAMLDVAGVVVVVPDVPCIVGSDATATQVGELQHRVAQGPLPMAVGTVAQILTPDLTLGGPPALAALAAEAGLVTSAAVALTVPGRTVGGLQVFGRYNSPVGGGHLDRLGPVLDVLSARIADVLDFQRMSTALTRAGAALGRVPEQDEGGRRRSGGNGAGVNGGGVNGSGAGDPGANGAGANGAGANGDQTTAGQRSRRAADREPAEASTDAIPTGQQPGAGRATAVPAPRHGRPTPPHRAIPAPRHRRGR